jgi:transcription initiation factor TFIIIB Brf1 subunit/transcription initiation factor TFIIB
MDFIYETCMYGSDGLTHERLDERDQLDKDTEILVNLDESDFDNPSYISSVKEELCMLTITNEQPQVIYDDDPDNIFGLVDDTDFVDFCNKETLDNQNNSYNICCGKEMSYNDVGKIECGICNLTKVVHGDYLVDHVNISAPQSILSSMKSSFYVKMFHSSKNDYNIMRDKYIGSILNRMYNAANTKLMPEIIHNAKDMCLSIMKVKTYRTKVLREIIAACLYYSCIKEKTYRLQKEIAQFVGLDTFGFSTGVSIVIEMSKRGVVNIETNINPTKELIDLNMSRLGIDLPETQRYKRFAYKVVEISHKNNISLNSMSYSKSIGSIYLIVENLFPEITIDIITERCKIHPNTIKKFTTDVKAYFSYFKSSYEHYGIPIPSDLPSIVKAPEIKQRKKKESKLLKESKEPKKIQEITPQSIATQLQSMEITKHSIIHNSIPEDLSKEVLETTAIIKSRSRVPKTINKTIP